MIVLLSTEHSLAEDVCLARMKHNAQYRHTHYEYDDNMSITQLPERN